MPWCGLKVESVCRKHGYEPPIIYTPQALMEGYEVMWQDDPIVKETRELRENMRSSSIMTLMLFLKISASAKAKPRESSCPFLSVDHWWHRGLPNTNPKKLLYESPHPGLLPLEKVTMRTYWDWYNTVLNSDVFSLLDLIATFLQWFLQLSLTHNLFCL